MEAVSRELAVELPATRYCYRGSPYLSIKQGPPHCASSREADIPSPPPEAHRLLAHTNVNTSVKGCGKPCRGPCRRFRSSRNRCAKECCSSLDHDTTSSSVPLAPGNHPFWFWTVSVITAAIAGTMVKSLEMRCVRPVCVGC